VTEKILFFFSALGVFNAGILSVYLVLFKPKRQLADYLLAILVFLLVIRVGVSCFQFFGSIPFEAVKLGLVANLLMGPAVWFYMKVMMGANARVVKQGLSHLCIWAVALGVSWFLFDQYTWDWRVRFVIHLGLSVYLVATALQWRKPLRSFLMKESASQEVRKGAVIFLSLIMICAGFAISLFTNYILGPMIFSVIFYGAFGYFLLGYQQEKKQSTFKKIEQEEAQKLHQKLTELMEAERLYRNPDLNLDLLAGKLSVSRHMLSQLLNDNLNKNFHQYINDYRIEEACLMLVENKHFSIEAVGTEVGFNSRSSFFTSFKRMKGMTPSNYRKQA